MEEKKLVGYDIDGVLTDGVIPEERYVVISGRTFAEYDETCKRLAQNVPLYIRGSGKYGDRLDAGNFKAKMINHLGVVKYYEDDQVQANIIKNSCPACELILWKL